MPARSDSSSSANFQMATCLAASTPSASSQVCSLRLSPTSGANPADTEPITVNGREQIPVTKSLASALRNVLESWRRCFPNREPSSFRLWADAICINQDDLAERSQQVRLMGELYSQAEIVLAWLGPDEDGTLALALESIDLANGAIARYFRFSNLRRPVHTLEWLRTCPELAEDDYGDSQEVINIEASLPIQRSRWRAIEKLFSLPYWSRVWIVQEVALSRNTLLISGATCLDMRKLGIVAETIRHPSMVDYVQSNSGSAAPPNPESTLTFLWDFVTSQTIMRIVTMWNAMVMQHSIREHGAEIARSQHPDWHMAFFGFEFAATDPRDNVFGMLGITKVDVVPDYTMSPSNTQIEFTTLWLDWIRTHDRSGLRFPPLYGLRYARPGAIDAVDGPSWAPVAHIGHKPIWGHGTGFRFQDGASLMHPYVDSRSECAALVTSGALLGSILRVHHIRDGEMEQKSRSGSRVFDLASVACQALARIPVTDTHSLQVLYSLICCTLGKRLADEWDYTHKALTFFWLAVGGVGDFHVGSLSGEETEAFSSNRERLKSLGLPIGGVDDFIASFRRIFCPGTPLADLLKDEWIRLFIDRGGVPHGQSVETVADFRFRLGLQALAEVRCCSEEGSSTTCLMLVGQASREGDVVCALQGDDFPRVLRRHEVGGDWTFVSCCTMIELEDGQKMETLFLPSSMAVEQFRIL